jgi:lipoprotein-releasing system ATP-binding protein
MFYSYDYMLLKLQNYQTKAMLTVKNIEFQYNPSQSFSFPDIHVQKGEHWLLLGQSGCGKTTLLHLMAGLLRPQSGEVLVNNTDITQLSDTARDKFRGEQIGIIFQQSHLIRSLTVEENLLTAQYLAGTKQDKNRVHQILEQLNLGHKIKSKPNNLSQGEQQRVSIGRALVNQPSVILADEPTSSLDDGNCEQVVKLLLEQSEASGASLIIVTHDGRLKEMFENKIELTPAY